MPTITQLKVLRLIARGYPNNEIAAILHMAPGTARSHTDNLLRRMHVRSRAEAVAVAYQEGWLP